MLKFSYGEILRRIEEKTGLPKEELEEKVNKKVSQLSDLVSKEGAAHIVANQLGVKLFENLAERRVNIKEIAKGSSFVNILGRVTAIYGVNKFNRNGNEGKVASIVVADETGSVRVAIWDDKIISVLENNKLNEGDIVKLGNGYSKDNNGRIELHLGNKSILENIKECKSINGNAIQIFLKSPIKSYVKINLTKTDISNINKYIKLNNIFLIIHGSYMLNMCWPIHRNKWAIQSLKDDLIMTSQLGGYGVVIHMGQNTPKLKISMRDALSNFVKSISSILDETPEECKLLLETSCNQKNSIAGKIEDLAKIWKMFNKK